MFDEEENIGMDESRSRDIQARDAGEGWQPIETAPKGKEVLVLKANGKYTIADWGRYCEYNGGNFTHWMPLPDPPVV